MSSSARSTSECKEYFDSPDVLELKIKRLARLVRNSNHFVAFTGAGISTSAGIADFRSGLNTCLDTGAGKWAKQAAVNAGRSSAIKAAKRRTDSFKAVPTVAHMSLVKLMSVGRLRYLISQNTDGLHRRSGIPAEGISELHGNRTMEVCAKCGQEYMRDFRCRRSLRKQKSKDHFTGRFCTSPGCKGKLHDTIVNFGESLPTKPLRLAEKHSRRCDLMLSLGSSLTVTPAADMPQLVGRRWRRETQAAAAAVGSAEQVAETTHNLVVVNLQKTPLDALCSLRIFAKIDHVMDGLMRELQLDIPVWQLNRFLKIEMKRPCSSSQASSSSDEQRECVISAVDSKGVSASVFTSVSLKHQGRPLLKKRQRGVARFSPDETVFELISCQQQQEEEKTSTPASINTADKGKEAPPLLLAKLSFYEHYQEPRLVLNLDPFLLPYLGSSGYGTMILRLNFDLEQRKWTVPTFQQQANDVVAEHWYKQSISA